ncbi:hypothetical protein WH47_07174 [Habropoda laboriosa]|uniref:Uncharacterized protein n=1 Tax=Habropoda laboriosa TaxID=597456 RepID=A0A0L7QQU3_9HYME|nr:hypothetical protein WH47_07174 [Habropoda laboriosa]
MVKNKTRRKEQEEEEDEEDEEEEEEEEKRSNREIFTWTNDLSSHFEVNFIVGSLGSFEYRGFRGIESRDFECLGSVELSFSRISSVLSVESLKVLNLEPLKSQMSLVSSVLSPKSLEASKVLEVLNLESAKVSSL